MGSEGHASDTQSEASSASWGSGDDMDDDADANTAEDGTAGASGDSAAAREANGDDDTAVAARRLAAETGTRTGRWAVPAAEDEPAMMFWDARAGGVGSDWAYHIQVHRIP